MGGGKGGGQTIGYWYDMDVLATLCHGKVDTNTDFELVELRWGDRTGWTGSVITSGSVSVYRKDLFGGETREGGVNGQIDIMMGTLDQPINEFLGSSMRRSGITGPVPAYRGEFSLFFRGVTPVNPEFAASGVFTQVKTAPPFEPLLAFFGKIKPEPAAFRWSAMNPYFKAFKARLRRYWKGWYPTKARIGNYSNPVHIIVECLTNSEWGMGYPLGDMDDTRNRAAADALYNESFGLGLVWRQQTSIQDFIGLVTQHINAVVNQDRTTGKVFVRLIRNDYNVDNLIELNPFNSTLEEYSRPGFGETVNEVTIKYVTAEGQDDSVTVQDIANITSQGQIISQTIEMPGIHDPVLAARIAQRELESRSRPICKITLVTNRIAFELYEGECFKFSWPDHGIEQMICRAVDVNLGDLQDNRITIEAVEDVFGLPLTTFVNPQPGGWVDPSNEPAPAPQRYITETPYYDLARRLPAADLEQLDPTDCALDVFATPPSRDALDYRLWTASGTADVELRSTGSHTAVATLTVAAVQEEFSVFTVDNVSGILDEMTSENIYLVINGEYVRLDDYNSAAGTFTVARGVLDTVPKAHAVGSKLMIGDECIGRDGISYVPGEVAKVRVQTRTSRGTLDIGSTPQDTYTFTGRQNRPYPPGRVRVNSAAYPSQIRDVAVVSWATRNRLLQTASMIAQDVTSVTPEALQLTKLVVKGEGAFTLVDVVTDATSHVVDGPQEFASGVTDAADGRQIRTTSLGLVSSPLATTLAANMVESTGGFAKQWLPVDAGWMHFSYLKGQFIDGTTGTLTSRNRADNWLTDTFETTIVKNPSTYIASVKFRSSGAITYIDPYEGYAIMESENIDTGVKSPIGQAADVTSIFCIRDRRSNPLAVMALTVKLASLTYWASNYASRRRISNTQFRLHKITKSQITSGPLTSTGVKINEMYLADPAQFNSSSGLYESYSPADTARIGYGFIGDPSRWGQLAVIFGNLLYLPYCGSSAVINTSGKSVNVTNILTGHIDCTTTVSDRTAVYTVDLSGNITFVATRNYLAIADRINATQGVEVENGTLRVVNSSTGAVGATIATLPSSAKALRVTGDTVSETIYVLADNAKVYRYNVSGTLLAQIQLPNATLFSSVANPIQMEVSQGYVYVVPQAAILGQESPTYVIEKNLSSFRSVYISTVLGSVPSGSQSLVWRLSASPSSSVIYKGKLLDENSSSTISTRIATPRYNDLLSVELSSTRNGVDSHTKHSLSMIRTGWGLRFGQSWGG